MEHISEKYVFAIDKSVLLTKISSTKALILFYYQIEHTSEGSWSTWIVTPVVISPATPLLCTLGCTFNIHFVTSNMRNILCAASYFYRFPYLFLLIALQGVGAGIGGGAPMVMAIDLAPSHLRGAFVGLWTIIGDIGYVVGPVLLGLIADFFGSPNFFLRNSHTTSDQCSHASVVW
ncbi:MAG: MFS transporter [Promethearchaeota archaeon]